MPRILVFAGSIRSGSFNARLAALAAAELARLDAEVTHISLADYPMPIYDGDLEADSGQPDNALKLKRLFCAHQGIFIAGPEYNAGVTPLLKNTIDWVSRVREAGEPPLAAYRNRVFALGSASPGGYAGMRSQIATRQSLELGCGAHMIPETCAVPAAHQAFDEAGNLKDERARASLIACCKSLVEKAKAYS
ncbi:NADPH-dependent FMN reductase [Phreatobacter sp. AB_2022a]|uniref:NADPH-dependent FMN reductase n=1 Tax=Phreatobacter sp. AB_2022a TaxID=3003134 RepID=UPI0022874A1E|nr:NAD(P)H-dependent oxidoreductase [Phreatobacter sp. AB_2022a]MCZ0734659.1 NAD(P)H-dependent oxidoreductase [Phreatobacter sp. AB_2022a]